MENKIAFKNNFHLLRLICSVLVVYSHTYALIGFTEPIIFSRSLGNFSVHCFFVLSGYLITLSYSRTNNPIDFLYRRSLRIIPALVVACFFAKFLASKCELFTNNPVPFLSNGSIWTLPWEGFCYLLTAAIGFIGLLTATSIGAFWLAAWIAIVSNFATGTITYQVIVPMLFMFLSGGFIAVNEDKFKLPVTGPIAVFFLLVLAIGKMSVISAILNKIPFPYGPQTQDPIMYFYLYGLLLPIALVYLGKHCPFVISLKDDISYGVYIYAFPIQQTLVYLSLKNNVIFSPIMHFAIALLFTVIISYVSWIWLEKPVASLKRIHVAELLGKWLHKIPLLRKER